MFINFISKHPLHLPLQIRQGHPQAEINLKEKVYYVQFVATMQHVNIMVSEPVKVAKDFLRCVK